MILHALLDVTADIHLNAEPGAPRYAAGNRYTVAEPLAAQIVEAGAAVPLEVPPQVCEDTIGGELVLVEASELERVACLERLRALVPPPPPPPPSKE